MTKDIIDLTFLKERYVNDISKPDVDKFERAAIIQSLMNDKGWSQRQFGRVYNVPHNTIQDWLLYNNIKEKEYNSLIEKGYSPTTIYRNLREKKSKQDATTDTVLLEIDVWLVEVRNKLRQYKKHMVYTPKTMSLIDDAVNELNSYGAAINSKQKRKQ